MRRPNIYYGLLHKKGHKEVPTMAGRIKVRVLGMETKEEVDHVEAMTVRQVLDAAGAEGPLPDRSTVTINGEAATVDSEVPEGAMVVVTPNVSNG